MQAIRQYTKRARPMTDVEMEEIFEKKRAALEGAEGESAEVREAVHEKQAAGHDAGWALDARVRALVGAEVVNMERTGECDGLMEAEAEAGAGDGVD